MVLEIDGMHCEACVRRVTAALGRVEHARVTRVAIGVAEVEAPGQAASVLVASLEKAGFAARVRS